MTIRFGPAAAPRWFNQDLDRFREYVDLIAETGGSAIEFVLYPGTGSEELGRFHLLEPLWDKAVRISGDAGLEAHAHAPLPPEFRLGEWVRDREGFQLRFTPVLAGLAGIESITNRAPTFVVHAADGEPEVTLAALTWMRLELERLGAHARIAIELRGPGSPPAPRFDRSLSLLGDFLDHAQVPGVGICWDVANDWNLNGSVSTLGERLLAWVTHVHLHDGRSNLFVHAPLDSGDIPWRQAIGQLRDARWEGSITLEIRYRYAIEHGEPWRVLRSNLLAVRDVLTGG